MFMKHPRHLFTAFVHGALDAATTAQVSEHARLCPRCAAELQSIRRAHDGIIHAPILKAPSSLWNTIEAETLREGASTGACIGDARRGTASAARSANAP